MSKLSSWGGRVIAATLLVCVAGCGSPQQQPPAASPTTTSAITTTTHPPSPTDPVEVEIPKIQAKSSLVPVGLNADQTLQVPPVDQPMQAAWYNLGPAPGQNGPAVILGHVDGNKQPGIFFRLREVAENDEVLVKTRDGKTVRFVVYRKEQVAKDKFPTEEVYGDTKGPELRVITCGGTFDSTAHSYRDNTIVFARLDHT